MAKQIVIPHPSVRERQQRLEEHREDLLCALFLIEMIEEEDLETPRLESLVALGKMALGSKLELVDNTLKHVREAAQ